MFYHRIETVQKLGYDAIGGGGGHFDFLTNFFFKIQFSFKVYKFEKGKFRDFLRFPEWSGCLFSFNKKTSNPFVRSVMNIIKKYLPSTNNCPYVGQLEVKELSLTDKILQIHL